MSSLKAVILDDEPPARNVLLEFLEELDWIEVIESFGDPHDALNFLNKTDVDLLFLDIEMPQINGFEVVSRLNKNQMPHIIFSTAYDEYAIKAFDINAVDYLLKPYTKARFKEAVKKARKRVKLNDDQKTQIDSLLEQLKNEEEYPDRLFVRGAKSVKPIKVDNILWIEADGDYSRLHLKDESALCSMGLGKVLEKLDPKKFVRVHRSHALSLSALRNLEPDGYGGFTALLENDKELKVSRSYSDQIKDDMI